MYYCSVGGKTHTEEHLLKNMQTIAAESILAESIKKWLVANGNFF
jgi:hypothetical protein